MTTKQPAPAREEGRRRPSMRGVARGSVANLTGAAVMAASTFGLTLLITHGVSRASAGILFSTTSLFLLASTLGMLGTNTGLVYFVARSRALERLALIPSYFKVAATPVVTLGVLMAVVLFVWAPEIAGVLVSSHAGEATPYLRALALFIPLAAIENVTLAATRGLGTMRATVLVEQIGRSLAQLALVALALLSPSAWTLALGWAFPYAPAAVLAYLWWRRASDHLLEPNASLHMPRENHAGSAGDRRGPKVGREFWLFSAPRALASLGQVAIQRLDIILVAALAGAVEAAVYAAATRFLVVGQMANRAISTAVQPRLAESLSRDDRTATNHLYQTSTAWLMMIAWPLYLTFICFGPTVMALFGRGYQAGSTVIVILAATMLVATGCGMVDMVLTMGGRTSWNLANVLAGLGLNIGVDLWLIPQLGMIGAAIGWAAAILAQNVLALSQTGIVLRVHPFGRPFIIVAALATTCFGLVGALSRLTWGTWPGLLISLVVGGPLYLLGLHLARGPLELKALRRR